MKTHTLLAVDDRAENLFVLKQLIAEHLPECSLVTAASAEEGLALAAEQSFDGILIDVQMPGIDGIEMCRRLKADEANGHLPILLITAHGSTAELRVRGLEAGADDFISRPIDNFELAAKIRVMLRIKRTEDELQEINARLQQRVAERTEALRDSEERYRAVFEQAADGIVVIDADSGAIVEFNDRAHENLGYTREEFQKLGIADLDVIESAEDVAKHLKKLAKQGSDTFETKHTTKDGEIRDVLVSARVLSLPRQNLVSSIWRDVTERKRAEENLRRSEAELSAIYENAPLVMMLVDRERRIVKINSQALSMARRSAEEVIGLRGGEVLRCAHLSDDSKECGFEPACGVCGVRNTVLRTFQSGKAFHRQEASIPYDHPDGPVDMHVLVSTTLLSVSEEDLVLVCLEDVTERKRAEEEIAKLAKFPSENPNPVLRVSRDGTILYHNQASSPLLELWKCRQGEGLSGKWRQFIADVISAGRNRQTELEWRHQTFSLTFAPVVDSGYVNVYALDITARKRAEQALRKAHQQLELRVKERTSQLSLANETLRLEITERKRAEAALRESELWLRGVFNSLEEAVLVVTPDRIVTDMNRAAQRTFGYSKEDLQSLSTTVLHVDEDHYAEFGDRIKGAFDRNEPANFEFIARRKNGDVFPTEHTVSLLKNEAGEPIGIVSVVRDITERKRAEEALCDSERNLSLIYDTVSDVLFQVGVEPNGGFRFLSVNQAFLDTTGLTEKQVVGKRIEEVIPEPSRTLVRGKYEEAVREKTTVTWEETSPYPSGVKIGLVAVTPALNEDGICTHLIGSVHDITERVRAEESLRESEERFRSLSNASFEGIAITENGRLVDANAAYTEIFGHALDELVGKEVSVSMVPEDREWVMARIRSGYKKPYELKAIRKDGSIIDIEVCGRSALYKGRKCRLTAIRDITERKRAEEAVRASETRYRSLFENMLDGYAYCRIILDDNDQPVDFVYLEVNDSFERLTGLEKDKTIGARATELIPGITESRPNLFEIYGKVALTGESTRFDLYFQPLQIWLSISVYCPQREYFVAIFDNITERKRTEEALRASEDRAQRQLDELNHLYNTAPVGLCLFDRDLRYLRINELLAAINGRSVEEHIGRTLAEVLPEVAGEVTPLLQQVIETGQPILNSEVSGPTPAQPGVLRHWLVNRYPVKAENGQVRAVGSAVLDITERKQAEERLLAMQAQLAHVARVSTVGEMVAGIAHEVNQPLCSIQNFAQASGNLLAAEKQVNLDDLREWNTAINRAAGHAVQVVKRLRRFLRRTESQRSFCRINEIVNEALHLVAFEAGRHKTTVRLELPEASQIVHVNRVEIQQVLVNLLQNAYEAMDESGTEVREVNVRTEPRGEFVEISVADVGPGLPSEGDSQIFSPFFTTKPDGLGMGLAIATTIVEAHDGKLRAASNRQAGATFHFTLPAAGEKQSGAE